MALHHDFAIITCMKRNIIKQLIAWKNTSDRKPLILQGARQVGKTYILRHLGHTEFSDTIHINFEKDRRVRDIFKQDLDPKRIINALTLRYEKEIIPEETLIIFDEIQECPDALNSLKYFCEEMPQYFIAAAGSLLGVKLANNRGFPVGKVNFIQLFPMSFMEFIQALGRDKLVSFLEKIENFDPIEEALHNDLCDLLKIYIYVGGMPEAVRKYTEEQNLLSIRKIHEEIIKAYLLDFAKHAPTNQFMKITTVWESLPVQLAKENKKFIFSAIRKSARAREYETAIQWLVDAGLVYPVFNTTVPRLPLKGYLDNTTFKLYLLDVGLLGAMSDLNAKVILEKNALFTEFKGALTENLAAQLLKTAGFKQLFYWTSGNTAEVDFILSSEGEIYPLEIKAGTSTKKKSLQVYNKKYQPNLLNRATLLNLKCDEKVCNYPLYLLEKFPIPCRLD